jgi:outer membrane protein assembly factor BamB
MALAYGIFYLALQMPHSVEVSALAGSTGRLRWRTTIWRCSGPLPFTENCLEPSLAVAHGLLFALNITVGKIASVDAETGRLVHTLNLPAVVRATGGYPHPLMVAGGALYVLGGRGHFLAMLPAPPR